MEFAPALLAPTLEDIMIQAPIFNKASNFLGMLPQRDVEYGELKIRYVFSWIGMILASGAY
jgi:hypothetical protein